MNFLSLISNIPSSSAARKSWGWREAILFNSGVLLLSLLLQWFISLRGAISIVSPWNWLAIIFITLAGVSVGAIKSQAGWLRWLAGPAFAITAISTLCILTLSGTLLLQTPGETTLLARLGLRQIFSSIPFFVIAMLLYINLSTVIGRRLLSRQTGKIAFLLNHAGMMLIIAGMVASSAQLITAYIVLQQGKPANSAFDDSDRKYILPAKLTLKRFEIANFPPQLKMATYDENGDSSSANINTHGKWLKAGIDFSISNINGEVLEYYQNADYDFASNTFVPSSASTGITAAKITYTLPGGRQTIGWIASGSGLKEPFAVTVDHQRLIYITEPPPKSYRSYLNIEEQSSSSSKVVEVNKPLRMGKWQIYQSSYRTNEKTGAIDSILMAVRDPALPLVYCGLFAILFGTFFTCWGSNIHRQQNSVISKEETVVEENKQ